MLPKWLRHFQNNRASIVGACAIPAIPPSPFRFFVSPLGVFLRLSAQRSPTTLCEPLEAEPEWVHLSRSSGFPPVFVETTTSMVRTLHELSGLQPGQDHGGESREPGRESWFLLFPRRVYQVRGVAAHSRDTCDQDTSGGLCQPVYCSR